MAILSLGALILLRNYDLTDEELGRLFILQPGNPESIQLLREIMDVATGHLSDIFGAEALTDPK